MPDIYEIVSRLAGDIKPVGDSVIDEIRFKNLEVICQLVDKLIYDIDKVSKGKSDYRHSLKVAGKYAEAFLNELGIEGRSRE